MPVGIGFWPGAAAVDGTCPEDAVTLDFDALLPAVGREEVLFAQALNLWAAASVTPGLPGSGFTNLGKVADGWGGIGGPEAVNSHVGDIRVGVLPQEGSVHGNMKELAHAFRPDTAALNSHGGGFGTIGGDVHIRPNDAWVTWVDDPNDLAPGPNYDLLTVMIHEVGHDLGLGHDAAAGSVMNTEYQGARQVLAQVDIDNIRALYLPEPATLLLLMMGGLLAARRR